jgi:outer membrane receptor protein involved in Fe transport
MIRKSSWLVSAGFFALATPTFAATSNTDSNDAAQPAAAPTAGPASQAPAQASDQPVNTGDIVITATRRNQALSDVPMAVSAVTAKNLQYTGATDIRQLNQVAPSLLVSSTTSEAGAAVARIRGIGTVGDNPGLEGSVGVFIDGVYRSRTGMGLTDLGPLDRIEVLRGPQGTLFGRNTSAGLISIITAKPLFDPEISAQIDAGNYGYIRGMVSATGPITDTLAVRLDTVYAKRNGFLHDVVSGRDVNDRDRGLVRGQVLYQPNDRFSFRLIGDISKQREECCAAAYLPTHNTTFTGGQFVETPSSIAAIENALGAQIQDDTFRRDVSITPGRNYNSRVNDGGVSGEINYDTGWGALTSITAYRYNKYTRGQDADYNALDILYRDDDGGSFNRFKTFSQELRLQGQAFDRHLDWLVGGYYANEKLTVADNLSYGKDYERYANCLIAANFAASPLIPDSILAPGTPTCFNGTVAAGVLPFLPASQQPVLAAFARLGIFAGPPFTDSGFRNLTSPLLTLNGSGLDDTWNQTSNNWALFTHNIISFNDRLKLTVGARYTHEQKKLAGDLTDTNNLCSAISSSILISLGQLPCVIPGVPGGSLDIRDKRTENKVSGTAVLSYKATDRLLAYASYSRGYKAGGFNLDRSALFRASSTPGSPPLAGFGAICVSPTQIGCQGVVASGADLQFKPETNDAYEVGLKYNGPWFDINFAAFHQLFSNFQLNTFNGLNFVVQNINSCATSLQGGDTDNNPRTGVCQGGTRAGVEDNGFELEAFTRPLRDLSVNGGVTYSNAKYRDNLVGANGEPLTNALFQLPGRQISNAPKWTVTGSAAWTPRIGSGGLRGLLYADFRYMSGFNTGSDLDIEKQQKAFTVVNARAGIHGPEDSWGIEIWAQNLFDKNFKQVAFDTPIQGSCTARGAEAGFCSPIPNTSTQLYSAFLGEPRTFGVTLRGRLGFHHAAPVPYVPAPAPVAEPAPPPPPPPPPPPAPVERGERG